MKYTFAVVFLLCLCHYALSICRVRYPKKVMCTFDYTSASGFNASTNIDPTICDIIHYKPIIYTPGGFYNGLNILAGGITEKNLMALTNYKQVNPNITIVVTLTVIDYDGFLNNDPDTFITNSVNDLKSRQLNGLVWDLSDTMLTSTYTSTLNNIVQRFSQTYTANALYFGIRNRASKSFVQNVDWTYISPRIDFLILATDFVSARGSTNKMELISGLYPRSGQTGDDLLYNFDSFVNYLVGLNVTKEKILMSLNLKTYRYTPTSPSFTNPNDNCTSFSAGSSFTSYTFYCGTFSPASGWSVRTSTEQKVSYAYNSNNNLWLTYDDSASIITKAEYIKNNNLYGFEFALHTDDYKNQCGAGRYPIINAARTGLSFNDL